MYILIIKNGFLRKVIRSILNAFTNSRFANNYGLRPDKYLQAMFKNFHQTK